MAGLDTSYIKRWSDEVHTAYQQRGPKLKGAVRVVTGVKAKTYGFHKFTKYDETGTSPTTIVQTPALGSDFTNVAADFGITNVTLLDYNAPQYIKEIDLDWTNVDWRKDHQMNQAMALGRQFDGLIITKLDAATPGTTVTASSGLTYEKVLEVTTAFNKGDVDPDDRYIVISPEALEDALGETEFTSRDYGPFQSVLQGKMTRVLGMTWICHTGLSSAGSPLVDACYAFNKRAIGVAMGDDIRTRIDLIPEKAQWLINSRLVMGAEVIDTAGLVKVNVTQ